MIKSGVFSEHEAPINMNATIAARIHDVIFIRNDIILVLPKAKITTKAKDMGYFCVFHRTIYAKIS